MIFFAERNVAQILKLSLCVLRGKSKAFVPKWNGFLMIAGTEAEGLLQIATSTVTRSSTAAANAMVSANASSSRNVKSSGGGGGGGGGGTPGRRKKPTLSSRERNVRRIESNERERLRMHGLNEAFQVRERDNGRFTVGYFTISIQKSCSQC